MQKNHIPTVLPLLGIIFGILLGQLMFIDCEEFKWFAILCCSILSVCILFKKTSFCNSVGFYIAFILLGLSSFHLNVDLNKQTHFSKSSENDSLLVNVIHVSPTKKGIRLTTKVLEGRKNDKSIPVSGKLMLYFNGQAEIPLYTDFLIPTKFKLIEEFKNPNTFNYAAYLRTQNIFHSAYLLENEMVFVQSPPSLKKQLAELQSWLSHFFESNIKDSKHAALVNALILGQKQNLSSETKKLFRENGLAHLLAISGMHVGIVLIMLVFCLSPVRNVFLKTLLIIIGIWFYILLSGAQIPALRAGFMLSVYLAGKLGRFNCKPLNSVFFSAMVLLCLDPNLLFQLSFQLSFAAMISILLFFNPIAKLMEFKSRILSKLWQLIALNISVQILILPITIYYFHQVPTYLMLNSLVSIPFMFIIMWLSMIVIALSFFEQLDFYVFKILELSLNIYTELLRILNELPHALISELEISPITLCMWLTAMIGFYYFFFGRKRQIHKIFWCFLPVILFSSFQNIQVLESNYLTIYDTPKELIFDIKQGDSVSRFKSKNASSGYKFYVTETGREEIIFLNLQQSSNSKRANNVITRDNFKIALLNSNEVLGQDVFAQVCIINSSKFNLKNIDQCGEFVIPRKIKITSSKIIKEQLKHHKKQFTCIREDGAFQLKIK